jgi:hypothetical protein
MPTLTIRCEAGKAEVILDAKVHLSDPRDDLYDHHFRVKFDDSKPESMIGSKATSHDAVFMPNAKAFIQRLRKAKNVMFEVGPYQHAPATSSFIVTDLDAHKEVLLKHCNIK